MKLNKTVILKGVFRFGIFFGVMIVSLNAFAHTPVNTNPVGSACNLTGPNPTCSDAVCSAQVPNGRAYQSGARRASCVSPTDRRLRRQPELANRCICLFVNPDGSSHHSHKEGESKGAQ